MGLFNKLRSYREGTKQANTHIEKSVRCDDQSSTVINQKEHMGGQNETGEYEIVERTIYPEKIICPDCGGVTTEGLEFCDKCAGELYKMF